MLVPNHCRGGKSYRVKIKVRIEVLSNNRALAIINAETVYTDK